MATAGAPPSSSSSSAANPTVSSSSIPPSGLPPPPPPPKILLAKPSPPPTAASHDPSSAGAPPSSASSGVVLRSSRNAPQPGSLNLFSDSWEFHIDRVLPFLTENTDFNVIGIIGPTGAGKSTIMNELYGFDGSSPGMLPPFATQSDETRAMAKHCTVGIELRVSTERLILLDAQPMFSPSVLIDMMRPDGSSAISVLNGESLSADLAHELMGIQVDLLKHGIPDPSVLTSGSEKDNKVNVPVTSEEHFAAPVFIHTKMRDRDVSSSNRILLKRAISQYFKSMSFNENKSGDATNEQDDSFSSDTKTAGSYSPEPDLFLLPLKAQHVFHKPLFGSYTAMLGQLRDQILSMNGHCFAKTVTERDWLRNSAKIWELVKKSPIMSEYCKSLQSSGLFRR